MTYSASLLALALSVSASASVRPPADTTGMIVSDGELIAWDAVTGRVDTTRYLIFSDSTVAIFSPPGDTAYIPYYSAIALGLAVDNILSGARVRRPFLRIRVSEGRVMVLVGRAVPVPLAIVVALTFPLAFIITIAYLSRRLRQERHQRRALQEVGQRLAEGREGERSILARELHDGPLQTLHALHMQLGVVLETLGPSALSENGSRRLRGAHDEVHTAIEELRGVVGELRPPALGPFGLAAALRAHADRFRRRYPQIALHLDLDDDGNVLSEPVRLALFRIAQEAMTNAAKHGEPSEISVSLRVGARLAEISVSDDGGGLGGSLDVGYLASSGHYGLLGMWERAEAIGAELTVIDDGEGVCARASVPLDASRKEGRETQSAGA